MRSVTSLLIVGSRRCRAASRMAAADHAPGDLPIATALRALAIITIAQCARIVLHEHPARFSRHAPDLLANQVRDRSGNQLLGRQPRRIGIRTTGGSSMTFAPTAAPRSKLLAGTGAAVAHAGHAARRPRRRASTRSATIPTGAPRPSTAASTMRSPTASTRSAGIEADIRMGGPQLNMSQILLGGVVDMVMSNSFEAINYAQRNLPFLCIGSIFQKDPQVIISHPGVGHDKLENLKGKTDPGRRHRPHQLLAVPEGQVRLHRRAGPPLHLQHPAVRRRQEDLAAGLPVVRALRHREGGRHQAGGPPDRRLTASTTTTRPSTPRAS